MQNNQRKAAAANRTSVASVLGAAVLMNSSILHAEGFRNPPPGGFSLARAGGRLAHIDTPAAIHHNPANLMDLEGPAVEATPTIVYIKTEHQNFSGQRAETRDPWKILPNIFASTPLMDNKMAIGLGITTPFGLSNEWEETGAFGPGGTLRYAAPYFSELITINYNPTVAVRLSETFTLGAGLDIYWSELKFRQRYPWAPWGGAGEGTFKAEGDGVGFGGNIGATWEPVKGHRLAATYRSPVTVTYEGEAEINNIPAAAAAFGATSRSPFNTEIEFPSIVGVGYGVEVTDTIRLEIDVEWVQFSTFQSLDLNVGNNGVLFPTGTSLRQDWNNTFTIGIGGDWNFAENWWVMGSYRFYETPVPDHTLTTTIPDADQHAFTTGLRYKIGQHTADLAYGYILYDDRTIRSNGAFNGNYETTVHLIAASYIYSF